MYVTTLTIEIAPHWFFDRTYLVRTMKASVVFISVVSGSSICSVWNDFVEKVDRVFLHMLFLIFDIIIYGTQQSNTNLGQCWLIRWFRTCRALDRTTRSLRWARYSSISCRKMVRAVLILNFLDLDRMSPKLLLPNRCQAFTFWFRGHLSIIRFQNSFWR